MKKLVHNQSGQGLLELIIAIGVIVTGLFGVWTLFLSNFSGEQESSYRIVGSNLAREGIEIVKNIRDSNWLKIENNVKCGEVLCPWDNGLYDTIADPEVVKTAVVSSFFDTDDAQLDFAPDSFGDAATRLYINTATGLYTHNSANASISPFQRLISLEEWCCPDVAPSDLKCDSISFSPCGSDMTDKLAIAVNVQSRVRWQVNGKERSITLEDMIYNWK